MKKVSKFQKEIGVILIIKLLAIGFIWSVWFSHPPQPQVGMHLMAGTFPDTEQSKTKSIAR